MKIQIEGSEMEKAYKIAQAKLQVLKITTKNMCGKSSKSCKTKKKSQKLLTKMLTPLKNACKNKTKNSKAVKN